MPLLGIQKEKKGIIEDFRSTITQADLFQMRENFANITTGQNEIIILLDKI